MNNPALHKSEKPVPGLYVVATPVGNLEDLGFRALRVLKHADVVAAEDTREARKLLDHYGIQVKTISIHEHTGPSRVLQFANSLREGMAVCAYISDAGTPGLCDPGADLVNACVEAGYPVFPVPGASALMSLLSITGSSESAFAFHGFFPREKKDREAWAAKARLAGGLHFFFESPHRFQGALEFLAEGFPTAPLVVGRELTKRFETITRGACSEVRGLLSKEEPRGEYVIALQLPRAEGELKSAMGEEELRAFVKELAELGAPQKALVRAAMSHGMRKNEAYKLSLEMLEK